MDNSLSEEIIRMKNEKDVAILAHYYVDGEVQRIADYVGDSFFLSKVATGLKQKNILFCGVKFMGESAKLLNPDKRVVMADEKADCPMAHMVTIDKIEEVRNRYDDVAVVCYINSTTEIKAVSDVCVTSSNALKVVSKLPQNNIFFVPDEHLGRYIAKRIPEKNFIFNEGFCHVHTSIYVHKVVEAKENHPEALVLTHPECPEEIIEISDFVGSTSEIIEYATKSQCKEFIVCTEMGVFYELEAKNPNKKFYPVAYTQLCPNMKRVTLDKVVSALEKMKPEICLSDDIMKAARKPLEKMLELAK